MWEWAPELARELNADHITGMHQCPVEWCRCIPGKERDGCFKSMFKTKASLREHLSCVHDWSREMANEFIKDGHKHTAESKAKISASMKRMYASR